MNTVYDQYVTWLMYCLDHLGDFILLFPIKTEDLFWKHGQQ